MLVYPGEYIIVATKADKIYKGTVTHVMDDLDLIVLDDMNVITRANIKLMCRGEINKCMM